jgi:hypothetical protein
MLRHAASGQIHAAFGKRVASDDAADGFGDSPEGTILPNGVGGVFGAGWMESAAGLQMRRDDFPIKSNDRQQNFLHFPENPSKRRRPDQPGSHYP